MSLMHDSALRAMITSKQLGIEPFDPQRVQPASIDLCLGDKFVIVGAGHHRARWLDVKHDQSDNVAHVQVMSDEFFLLRPEQFVLAATLERIRLAPWLAARVEGKSSLGRLGVMVHSTAGFIDPGFEGHVTLELSNMLEVPIKIYPGMPVCQLAVFQMAGSAHPYTGKYQNQDGPMPSLYHLNFQDGSADGRIKGHG